ncbi:microtubule-associated protein futsch [Diachasma alloeum]|uniref:microtubule-associated protein futsch n=1 Tax=Diachasma alloeum TaxID=454923 RepID=UPI0007382449|nr:microtubule-associated protein futsch [Diachasma alloeum]
MEKIGNSHAVSVDSDDEERPSWRGIRHEGTQFSDEDEGTIISRSGDTPVTEVECGADGRNLSEFAIKRECTEESLDIDDYVYKQITFVELSDDNYSLNSPQQPQQQLKTEILSYPDNSTPKTVSSFEKFAIKRECTEESLDIDDYVYKQITFVELSDDNYSLNSPQQPQQQLKTEILSYPDNSTPKTVSSFEKFAIKRECTEESLDIDDYVYTQIIFVELSDDEEDRHSLNSPQQPQQQLKTEILSYPEDSTPEKSKQMVRSPEICRVETLDEFEAELSIPRVPAAPITHELRERKRKPMDHVWKNPRVQEDMDLDSMKSFCEDRSFYAENTDCSISFKSLNSSESLQDLEDFRITDENRSLIHRREKNRESSPEGESSSGNEREGFVEEDNFNEKLDEKGNLNEILSMFDSTSFFNRDNCKVSEVDEVFNANSDEGRGHQEGNEHIPKIPEDICKNQNDEDKSDKNLTDEIESQRKEDDNVIENSEVIDSEGEIGPEEMSGVFEQIEHREKMSFSEILEGINPSGAVEDRAPRDRSSESIYDAEDPFMDIATESQLLDFDKKLSEAEVNDESISIDFDYSDQDLEEIDTDEEPEPMETSSRSSSFGDQLTPLENLQESIRNISGNISKDDGKIIEDDGVESLEGNNCRREDFTERMEISSEEMSGEVTKNGKNHETMEDISYNEKVPGDTVSRDADDTEEDEDLGEGIEEPGEDSKESSREQNPEEEGSESDETLSLSTTSDECPDDTLELDDMIEDLEKTSPLAESTGLNIFVGVNQGQKKKSEGCEDDVAVERAAKVLKSEETVGNNILVTNIHAVESVKVTAEEGFPRVQSLMGVDRSNIPVKFSPMTRQDLSLCDKEVEPMDISGCRADTLQLGMVVKVKESETSSGVSSGSPSNSPPIPSDHAGSSPCSRRPEAPARTYNMIESSSDPEESPTRPPDPPETPGDSPTSHDHNYTNQISRKRFRMNLFPRKSDSPPRKKTPQSSSKVLRLRNPPKMKFDDVFKNIPLSQKRQKSSLRNYNSSDDENDPHVERKSEKKLPSSQKKKRKLFHLSASIEDLSEFLEESNEKPVVKSPEKFLKSLKGLRKPLSPVKTPESKEKPEVTPRITNSVPQPSPQVYKSKISPVTGSELVFLTERLVSSRHTSSSDLNTSPRTSDTSVTAQNDATDSEKIESQEESSKSEDSDSERNSSGTAEDSPQESEEFINLDSDISPGKSPETPEDENEDMEIPGTQVSHCLPNNFGEASEDKSLQKSGDFIGLEGLDSNLSPGKTPKTPGDEDKKMEILEDKSFQISEDFPGLKGLNSKISPAKTPETPGDEDKEIEIPETQVPHWTSKTPGEASEKKSPQKTEDITGLKGLGSKIFPTKYPEGPENEEEPLELPMTQVSHWTPNAPADASPVDSNLDRSQGLQSNPKTLEPSVINPTASVVQSLPTACQPTETTPPLGLEENESMETASPLPVTPELGSPDVITQPEPCENKKTSEEPVQEPEIPQQFSSTSDLEAKPLSSPVPSPPKLPENERPFKLLPEANERIAPPPPPPIGDEHSDTEAPVKISNSSRQPLTSDEDTSGLTHISQLRKSSPVMSRALPEASSRPGPSWAQPEPPDEDSWHAFSSCQTPKFKIRSDFIRDQNDGDSDGCESSLETCSNPPPSHISDDSDYQSLDDGRSKHSFPSKFVKPKKKNVKSKIQVSERFQAQDESYLRACLPESRNDQPAGGEMQLEGEATRRTIKKLHKEINSKPGPGVRMEAPKGMLVSLMDHQKEALPWMLWRETCKPAGGILADDMGLGKTILTIALVMESLNRDPPVRGASSRHGPLGGTLVVCPAGLVTQWYNEFDSKSDVGHTRTYHKDKETNPKILAGSNVVITTYDTLNRNYTTSHQVLFKVHWRRVVLDEAHMIRNPKSLKSIRIAELTTDKRWCLTGTPVHNKVGDLYPIMRFLNLEPFNDQQIFNRLIDSNDNRGTKRLFCVMQCVMLRRMKEGVFASGSIPQLPLKTLRRIDIVLVQEERLVYDKVMTHSKTLFIQFLHQREQRSRTGELGMSFQHDYRTYTLSKSQRRFLNRRGIIEHHHILTLILRLRQICCHPALIWKMLDKSEFKDAKLEEMKNPAPLQQVIEQTDNFIRNQVSPEDEEEDDGEIGVDERVVEDDRLLSSGNPVFREERKSSKMVAVLQKVQEIVDNGEKVVIVSDWVQYLTLIGKHLVNMGFADDSFKFYTGSTDDSARDGIVECFNTKLKPKILLLSLRAGGQGLNLTGANHVIIVDVHWNPQLEVQAQDRIYRIGQTRDVFVHKFICQDTIEERIVELQRRKLQIAENVLSGTQGGASGLGIDELRSLFSV